MASEALRKAGQVQHLAAMQDALKQFDLPRIRARRWEPGMPVEEGWKLIHWIRHGQGYHNLLAEAMRSVGCAFSELGDYEEAKKAAFHPYVNDAIVDPPLTCLGIQDAKDLWPKAKTLKPELLVVSPLKRASETIMIGFKEAIQQGVPLMAHDACREQFGVHVCDRRGTRTDYAERWPHVDVSCVTHDEDPSSLTKRESKVELARRGHDFLQWLSGRPEKEIVVGTHSAFLMGVFHIALEIEDESMKNFFKTGELRSVLLEVQAEQSAKRRKL
ncbi:Phosphoglycerate mutase-like protein (AtPGM) [Durusdinium trenchii]|uniref:Phosphoglycerate mutase-like protein (AtPGM) n=1 Tax=Durusdinium trenchii TaxID=1381693 RepID=A0ABP0R5M9_9DINO